MECYQAKGKLILADATTNELALTRKRERERERERGHHVTRQLRGFRGRQAGSEKDTSSDVRVACVGTRGC